MDLSKLLHSFKKPVEVILSSLPLRSMNPEIVEKIQTEVFDILTDKGLFIQFTYDPRENSTKIFPKLKLLFLSAP